MYVTPIRLVLLLNTNQISCYKDKWYVRRFDPDTVENGHIYSSVKEEEVFIYWVYLNIFCGYVRLRILWAGLIVFSNWIISQRKRSIVWDITVSTRWRASFSCYIRFWIKWVLAALLLMLMLVGTIVFKGVECTSGNVKRLWQGSNRLRVVVKPTYCCRVEGQSLISASIDH